jgi:Uncharacterized protein conserved in bacteria (DUF2325)
MTSKITTYGRRERFMADTGHSVFAPFARLAPNAGVPRIAQSADIVSVVRCDHKHQFTLTPLPASLVKRATTDEQEDPSTRRTKIWEFSQNLHCSIIGTCLSTAELRQTLTRLGLAQTDWTDHDLHHKAVSLAVKHDQAARVLHKALDRRHKLPISQFGRARTEADLTALWRDAVKRGDIPGAYWAVLTHPATTQALVRLVFGEVHMLSHLVGAANRADIRRLCELEQRNAELETKLRAQQAALHQAIVTRDASIRDLRQSLRQRLQDDVPAAVDNETAMLRGLIGDLEKRLAVESRRRTSAETRLAETRDALMREQASRHAADTDAAALRAEIAAAESGMRVAHPESEARPGGRPGGRMDGLSLLYVGGRPAQIAHLRDIAESLGATFLHHDGGVEHHPDLLPGLTSRADAVFFPVDCVSHDAALMVKRLCRQADKRFIPLRSSGATSFLAALRGSEVAAASVP